MAWAHGLCSCCEGGAGPCLLASCFPCVLIGKNAEGLDQGNCCCYGFLSACFPCLGLIFTCQHRGIIREREGIEVSLTLTCQRRVEKVCMSFPDRHYKLTYLNR